MSAESTMYTFRMTFAGLCAFVPNKEWSSRPTEVTVALRDLAQLSDVKIPEGFLYAPIEQPLAPHFSFFLYQVDQLDEETSTRESEIIFKRSLVGEGRSDEKEMGLSYLAGEEIMIGLGENKPPRGELNVEYKTPSDDDRVKRGRSLWHLANLERVAKKSGTFNEELLDDGQQVGRARLHCHFTLTHGSLYASNHAKGEWQFHRSEAPRQSLASSVSLEFTDVKEPVVLYSRTYEDDDWKKIMQFRPADAETKLVEVRVFNRELSGIFRPAPDDPQREDRDFAHYYDMSKRYGPSKKRPFPRLASEDGGGLSHPDGCSPGGFDGKG